MNQRMLAQSTVNFTYNDYLALDDTKWHYLTKATFEAAPRSEQRVWHHVGRLLFTEDGVNADEPCTRCAAHGEICRVYSEKAQAERKQVVKLPIRCAHCVVLNIPCFSRRQARERREREEGATAEVNSEASGQPNPDESRQPRAAAAQPTYSLKQLSKNAGAYRYAEMYPPEPKKRSRKPSGKASEFMGLAVPAISANWETGYNQVNVHKKRPAGDISRVSVSDLTETREKARAILNNWGVPLAEKTDPIKILLRQNDWFPRAKAEGWYHYGATKAAQMRKIKGVKALQQQIKADEELQRKAEKQQKEDEKIANAAQKEAQKAQQDAAPPAQMLPASQMQTPALPPPPQWSEVPPPWAFPEWLSGSAPLPEPYEPYQPPQAPRASPPTQPPKDAPFRPFRKMKPPVDASKPDNLTRSYVRVKPLSWQYPKVPTTTLLNYVLSPAARDLLPDSPVTVSYNSAPNPFTILLASVLLSRPGYKPSTAHSHAHAAASVLLNPPYSFESALALHTAGEKPLMQALAEARQIHRPKIIGDVNKLVEVVQSDLVASDDLDGTQLQLLRLQGGENADFGQVITFLSNALPCLNPTGLEAFIQRIQVLWPEYFPHLSKYAADSLKKLNFPQTAEPLMTLIDDNWAAIGQWDWAGGDEDQRKKRAFVVLLERAIAANFNDYVWEVMTAASGGDIHSGANYRPARGGEDSLADLLRSEATTQGLA